MCIVLNKNDSHSYGATLHGYTRSQVRTLKISLVEQISSYPANHVNQSAAFGASLRCTIQRPCGW